MNSLFASHKGRVFKKVFIGAFVLALLMFMFGGGGGDDPATSEVMVADSQPQVNYSRVYAPTQPTPEPTPTAPVGVNDEAIITNQVKEMSRDFVQAWTTYDYQTPPSYGVFEGAAQDPQNNGALMVKYEELVAGMEDRNELSTGNIGSVNITSLNYRGNAQSGTGEGTVKVTVNVTVSNSEVGSAGTTMVRAYEVKLMKQQSRGSADGSDWFIYDIVTLS